MPHNLRSCHQAAAENVTGSTRLPGARTAHLDRVGDSASPTPHLPATPGGIVLAGSDQ